MSASLILQTIVGFLASVSRLNESLFLWRRELFAVCYEPSKISKVGVSLKVFFELRGPTVNDGVIFLVTELL